MNEAPATTSLHDPTVKMNRQGVVKTARHIALQCAWLLMLFSSLLVTGCRGCSWYDYFTRPLTEKEQQDREASEQDEEKKNVIKQDFVTRTPILLPGYFPPPYDPERERKRSEMAPDMRAAMEEMEDAAIRHNRFKMGHWAEIQFMVMANNSNADGQLSSHSVAPTGEPVPVMGTPFYPLTRRPVSLMKGEWKYLETSVFFPRRERPSVNANTNFVFDRGPGSIPFISMIQGTQLMRTHEYHLVVLSERPSNFDYLKLQNAIALDGFSDGFQERATFYHVVPTVIGEPAPLPGNALAWTTIAYLVWDDYDPGKLSSEQQTALMDWLHFGGQLIVSGPDGLERLQNSFLGPFLPARSAGNRNLTENDLEPFNQHWSIPLPTGQAEGQVEYRVSDRSPLIGVDFAVHEDADLIAGAGELAIERYVGRGRIVVTSFSLNSDLAKRWRSFPSFFNSALLRRPARQFTKKHNGNRFDWVHDSASIFDPLIGSTLRFASRDLGPQGTRPVSAEYVFTMENEYGGFQSPTQRFYQSGQGEEIDSRDAKNRNLNDFQFYGGFEATPESGVAGWNDDSAVSRAARQTLVEAAGIIPPSSGFVLRMLGGYLIVLVPLNWLLFWMLGRVEWAWIAVPIIAIAGSVVVIKRAALDIGFVRSNTQVGLLEAHSGYSRGHASEYSALYTSLSTRYQADLDNATAQILPLPGEINPTSVKREKTADPVLLQKDNVNRLGGFQIQSNATGLLHHEYVADLGGAITAQFNEQGDPVGVKNGTSLDLSHAGVIWQDNSGQSTVGWIGELPAGSQTMLEFTPVPSDDPLLSWKKRPLFSNLSRFCRQVWSDAGLEPDMAIEFGTLISIEAMQPYRSEIESLLRYNRKESLNAQTLIDIAELEFAISRSTVRWDGAHESAHEGVGLGRILDAISNLELNNGEVRLIASTHQPLGQHRFIPVSTRTDQQTLVLIHLRRPKLSPVQRDENALIDLIDKNADKDW